MFVRAGYLRLTPLIRVAWRESGRITGCTTTARAGACQPSTCSIHSKPAGIVVSAQPEKVSGEMIGVLRRRRGGLAMGSRTKDAAGKLTSVFRVLADFVLTEKKKNVVLSVGGMALDAWRRNDHQWDPTTGHDQYD
jgi:hypothetical protein